ncbi:hypothetical protein ACSQ67_002805 [Phaseolus vulgaris]
MKHFVLVFLLAILAPQECFHATVEARDGFVRTRGIHFMLNGYPYYANGFNAYWLMYTASDPSQRFKVSNAFREAASHGLTVARTWAFSDGGYRPLQYSPGFYNDQMFMGLDFVISEARKYGIKLILSLVNNYENFGGKKQYVNWARSQGQYLTSDDDFFRSPVVKGYYMNHVRTVLNRYNRFTGTRYKDDPTIMAWELMNEPRCTSDPSGRTIQAWITEMAWFVKSIDRNHLLEAGLEGVSSSNDQYQLSFLNSWLSAHFMDAQYAIRKPVLVAEFGKSLKGSEYERDEVFNAVYYRIYASAKRGGAAGGALFWQLLTGGMESFQDGYGIMLGQSSSTADLIARQSRKLFLIRKIFARVANMRRWRRSRGSRGFSGSGGGNGGGHVGN